MGTVGVVSVGSVGDVFSAGAVFSVGSVGPPEGVFCFGSFTELSEVPLSALDTAVSSGASVVLAGSEEGTVLCSVFSSVGDVI